MSDAAGAAPAATHETDLSKASLSPEPSSTGSGHEAAPSFVAPSHYLRPHGHSRPVTPNKPMSPLDQEQIEGLVSCLPL